MTQGKFIWPLSLFRFALWFLQKTHRETAQWKVLVACYHFQRLVTETVSMALGISDVWMSWGNVAVAHITPVQAPFYKIICIYRNIHVRWVLLSPEHGAASRCGWRGGVQKWRAAAIKLTRSRGQKTWGGLLAWSWAWG
jgi:hypothetical protein